MSDTDEPIRPRTVPLPDDDSGMSEPGPTMEVKTRTPTFRKLEQQLVQTYVGVGVLLSTFDNSDGTLIVSNAEALAASWVDLAEQDPKVKRALDKFMQGGAWSGVFFAHIMVALPILANHNVLPANIGMMFQMQGQSVNGHGSPNG